MHECNSATPQLPLAAPSLPYCVPSCDFSYPRLPRLLV